MPYAVETGSDSGNRGKKSVSHPNGQYSIFLSQCLPGTNRIVIFAAYSFPYIELKETGYTRNKSQTYLIPYRHVTMDYTLHSYGNGKSQRHCP